LIWYGFLFALIAAELFAGRVLRHVVRRSLGRPSLDELEGTLREPLGDPGLRLGFWSARTREWVGHDGAALGPLSRGQVRAAVDRDGRPAVAIVHDAQLCDDPELLQAAGAAALLAREHAELDAAWRTSLGELRDSRARLASAADRERRKLERDLHDGAQQRLMGIQVKLRMAQQRVVDPELATQLEAVGVEAEASVEELRALAHGIYPPGLRDYGPADALRAFAMTAPIPIEIVDEGIGRCPRAVEAAIYFCAMEAVQNATKHAGSRARVTITLGRDEERGHFAIADDGQGSPARPVDDGSVATRAARHRRRDRASGSSDRSGATRNTSETAALPGRSDSRRAHDVRVEAPVVTSSSARSASRDSAATRGCASTTPRARPVSLVPVAIRSAVTRARS
jgi:signal transduction histidine kinase